MTPEEKLKQMNERNAAICAFYQKGNSVAKTASVFMLSRDRTYQILHEANILRARVKSTRTLHLGVTVTKETKQALKEKAKQEGKSVSELTAQVLKAMLG